MDQLIITVFHLSHVGTPHPQCIKLVSKLQLSINLVQAQAKVLQRATL